MRRSLWSLEGAIALRSGLARLLLVAFALVSAYALASGVLLQRSWSRGIAEHRAELEARLTREQENVRLHRVESWSEPGAVTGQKMHLTLPPAPGVIIATGDAALRPHAGELAYLRRVDTLFKNSETQSALVLSLGRLDFAWVGIVLLPLLVIALGYDLLAADRDAARLGLLALQAGSLRAVLVRRLAVRLAGPCAVLLAGALAAVLAGADAGAALLSLALLLAWGLVWALVVAWVTVGASSSQTAALSLLLGWLFVVVVLPSTLDLASDALSPVPSRAEDITAERQVQIEVNAGTGKLLERYAVDHPELVGESRDEWQRTAALVLRETEERLEPLWARQAESREKHARVSAMLTALSPASALDAALRAIAGTDGHRHEAFVSQSKAFTRAWRARLADKLFRVERLTPEEIAGLPRFAFVEPGIDGVPVAICVVQLLVVAAVLSGGLRRALALLTPSPARTALAALGFAVLALASSAAAETPSAGPSPPVLLQAAPFDYPPRALEERREGVALLRLTISAEGVVTATEIVESAGADLDAAACRSASRFRFSPAMRDGVPRAARILYHYEIRLPAAAGREGPARGASEGGSPAPMDGPPKSSAASLSPDDAAPKVVVVRGALTEAEARAESAEAVTVVDTRRARQRTADLGEVLARTQGVSVQRSGGLGSHTHIALNGLYDDQIRFFLDGVPLELAGYPFGVANVPLNLVERIEVYRGVVPIRYGADSLGGAIDLIRERRFETGGSASFQMGSFGTYRATLTAGKRDEERGLWVGGSGFYDYALNNYAVDVSIPDALGRPRPARVNRFHDRYRASGGSFEVGVLQRAWADRLLFRFFTADSDRDIQHNNIMTSPYGEATAGDGVTGLTVEYAYGQSRRTQVSVVVGYAYRTIDFVDKASFVYNWRGQRVRERLTPGEIGGAPIDQTVWQHSALARASVGYQLHPHHTVRLATAPTVAIRSGDTVQNNPRARDPLTADKDVYSVVSGLELASTAGCGAASDARRVPVREDCRWLNVAFGKSYLYRANLEEVLSNGAFRKFDNHEHRLGVGDSLRVRLTSWLSTKASYELATRLPGPDELFGNGTLIQPNVNLRPETSHNVNVGPRVFLRRSPVGSLVVDVNAFWRETDDLIVLLGDNRLFFYQNVYATRSLGFETAVAWTTPFRPFSLEGSATYVDVRNTSTEGTFADYQGDRVPSRPWLFGSWGARLASGRLFGPNDSLSVFYTGRYTHEFFRVWESAGFRDTKQVIESQTSHGAGVTYTQSGALGRLASTLEVQNLTDARLFDFFGVQRPGRAFFCKVSGEILPPSPFLDLANGGARHAGAGAFSRPTETRSVHPAPRAGIVQVAALAIPAFCLVIIALGARIAPIGRSQHRFPARHGARFGGRMPLDRPWSRSAPVARSTRAFACSLPLWFACAALAGCASTYHSRAEPTFLGDGSSFRGNGVAPSGSAFGSAFTGSTAPASHGHRPQRAASEEPVAVLGLADVIRACVTRDPRIRAALEGVKMLEAESLTASLLPNPGLTVSRVANPFPWRPFTVTAQGGPPQLDLGVSYRLDTILFGKRTAAMDSARLAVDVAAAEYADVVRLRVTEAIGAYFDVLTARALFALTRDGLERMQRLEVITTQRVTLGSVGAIEQDRVKLATLAARRELLTAEAEIDKARCRLRALVGAEPADPPIEPAGGLQVDAFPTPPKLAFTLSAAEASRPDLIAARRQVQRTSADVGVERTRAYPEVEIGASYTYQYQERAIGFPNVSSWGVSLGTSLPLFDRNQGSIARAEAGKRQADENLRAARSTVRAEVEQALRQYQLVYDFVTKDDVESLEAATRARDSIQESYRLGGRTLLEVLDSQRAYAETVRLVVGARGDFLRAMHTLNAVVGRQVLP